MLKINSKEQNGISLSNLICSIHESQLKGKKVDRLMEKLQEEIKCYNEWHGVPPYELASNLVDIGFFTYPNISLRVT